MALTPGTRLGPYEVGAQIGAGGMGVVYRARDTRLDRTVAIKVLPEALAFDAERLARFEREAKSISSLNHPHICTLYDVGRQRELFYVALDARLMSVPIVAGPESIEAGAPVPLFATQIGGAVRSAQKQQYIVSLDGQRFLMNTVAEEASIPITLRLTGSTNR